MLLHVVFFYYSSEAKGLLEKRSGVVLELELAPNRALYICELIVLFIFFIYCST